MESNCIQEGDKVIFKRNGACRAFQVRKNRQVFFVKNKFSVNELIDQPYGSTFELDRGKLIKVGKAPSEYDSKVQDPISDNRDLIDADSNQKMTKDEIMKMKEEGVTGEKIIEEITKNSETFKNKTEFSQAKYLKKKKNKHITTFTVLRPTPRLVMDIFSKEPQKICNLRADTLSQMLNFSNIMCGSNVAVVETCQGLLLSCVLQRLGGQGKIVQLVPNSDNPVYRQVMDYFDFTKEELDNVYSFPMSVLSDLKENYDGLNQTTTAAGNVTGEDDEETLHQAKRMAIGTGSSGDLAGSDEQKGSGDGDEPAKESPPTAGKVVAVVEEGVIKEEISEGDVAVNAPPLPTKEETEKVEGTEPAAGETSTTDKPFVRNRDLQRKARSIRHKEAADIIMSKKLDSLLIACKYNPAPIVKQMLEFLPLSRSVVVYCQYLEPLVEIYTFIKDHHVGLQVKLSETWLREYQVLPQRTHPVMNMSGNGGYLLTFITCDPTQTD